MYRYHTGYICRYRIVLTRNYYNNYLSPRIPRARTVSHVLRFLRILIATPAKRKEKDQLLRAQNSLSFSARCFSIAGHVEVKLLLLQKKKPASLYVATASSPIILCTRSNFIIFISFGVLFGFFFWFPFFDVPSLPPASNSFFWA